MFLAHFFLFLHKIVYDCRTILNHCTMARGDVISEVFDSNGQRTGSVVYNESRGTVRQVTRSGRTAQGQLQTGAARYANPRNNPLARRR